MHTGPRWCEAASFGDILLRTAAAYPDAEALVFPGERLSYGELAANAQEVARGLIGLGVGSGESVGVLMANSIETVTCLFGIALAGAVAVPINARYRAVEIPYVVENADVTVILTSDRVDEYMDFVALLSEALPGIADAADPHDLGIPAAPSLRSVVLLGSRRAPGTVSDEKFKALAASATEEELLRRRAGVRLRGIALVLYTSGTTAQPRGCLLSHECIVRDWIAVGHVLRVAPGDRVWSPCPLYHMAAIGPLIFTVVNAAVFVSDVHFEPNRALELIERERATVLYPAYPPITQGVINAPGFPEADLSSARVMLNVAPPDTLRQMQDAIPHAIQVSLYGSTECGGAVTYHSLDDDLDTRVTTCGTPLPGIEVDITDPETGDRLPTGSSGEILVRGYNLAEGYHKDPEKTARTYDADGWFHTGDHGLVDERGHLRFLGRLKDMLKVGGENVAPAEVESVLSLHPAVKLVQVLGVPDSRLDEVPAAFVELRPGQEASAEELVDFCRGRMARFKLPAYVRFVDDWPMSATKIQKAPLRERLLEELGISAAR